METGKPHKYNIGDRVIVSKFDKGDFGNLQINGLMIHLAEKCQFCVVYDILHEDISSSLKTSSHLYRVGDSEENSWVFPEECIHVVSRSPELSVETFQIHLTSTINKVLRTKLFRKYGRR